MRVFFGLLLCLNIAFFAWQYQVRGGFSDHDTGGGNFQPTDPGVAALTLLIERPAGAGAAPTNPGAAEALPLANVDVQGDPQDNGEASGAEQAGVTGDETAMAPQVEEQAITPVGPETQAGAEAIPAAGPRCLELGPSPDRATIESLAAAVQQAGAHAVLRESAPPVTGGYWVRLPEYFTFAEARAKYRELQQKGVDDIAIVPLPDKRYFISLGVYKKKDTVEERRDEILAKGVTPMIEDRAQAGIAYTVEIEYAGTDPGWVASLQGALSAQAPQIELHEVACR